MVSSFTENGRFTKQGTNDNPNTWGTILNNQVIALMEQAVFGVQEIIITGSTDYTLTTANGAIDEARNAVLELRGTIGADIDVLLPSVDKVYMIRGDWVGPHTVTMRIASSLSGVTLNSGETRIIYTNGTDTYDLVNVDLSDQLRSSANLSDLANIVTARNNLGLGDLATFTLGTGFSITGTTLSVPPVPVPHIVGEVKIWPTATAPAQFVICDGRELDRTTYAALFAVIGTTYGDGNGTTTFNAPDYRGYFLRGTANGSNTDPDAASRLNRGDGTTGDNVGTRQLDEVGSHIHDIPSSDSDDDGGNRFANGDQFSGTRPSEATGGAETRPRNVGVNYVMYTGV